MANAFSGRSVQTLANEVQGKPGGGGVDTVVELCEVRECSRRTN